MVCGCCSQIGHNITHCNDAAANIAFAALSIVAAPELKDAIARMTLEHVSFALMKAALIQGTRATKRARLEAEMRMRAAPAPRPPPFSVAPAPLGAQPVVALPVALLTPPSGLMSHYGDGVIMTLMPNHRDYAEYQTRGVAFRNSMTRIKTHAIGHWVARALIDMCDRRSATMAQSNNDIFSHLIDRPWIDANVRTTMERTLIVYCPTIAARIWRVARDYIEFNRYHRPDVAVVAVVERRRKLTIKVASLARPPATAADEPLCCGICQDEMDHNAPVIAGCGHTFCVACIEGTARARGERSFIRCPLCREEITKLTMQDTTALKESLKNI